jgi:predicted Zn-dependent protease
VNIGKEGSQQVEQSMAMVDDPELQAYVARLGQQLAAASERPDLPWSFKVVDDPTPNAFALPGGPIYFTRGMLTLMDSEAELVTVLGHEIAHVTARHSVEQISRAQLTQLGVGLGMILIPELRPFGDVAGLGLNLLMLKYGRDAEREADELGFGYARAQNYDVSEMADVFESLGRMADLEEQSPLPSWLSTHPAPDERVRAVNERLASRGSRDLDATVGRAEFLEHIDGLTYGANPRNGFFREGVFYHPELAFQFAVPRAWQTQNLARAVLAVSPEQDAAMQLTLAPGSSPDDGLRRFLSQQGVQAGPARGREINGIPAAAASFQAQTQQGVVAGRVAFLAYDDNLYQLVTYAPAQRFDQYQATFGDIIASFEPLDDPDILEVEPAVIDIARVERDMTLAEFDRANPSAIPIERLAILNQLEGPDSRLSKGTLVKRVVGDPELLAE